MGKKIAAKSVWVECSEGRQWFHPGDEIPQWAQDAITNETVYAGSKAEADELVAQADAKEDADNGVVWDTPEYENFSVAELKELLEERNLETTGLKPALIERLEESDVVLG